MDRTDDRALCQSTVCRPDSKGGPRQAHKVICDQCAERFGRDLQATADMWEDLTDRVSAPEDYVITERIKGTKESFGIDINQQVSDAKTDLIKFTWWLTDLVITNKMTVKAPADQSTPSLLAWVARWHTSLFTRDLDKGNIIRAVSVAHKTRSNIHRNAYPSGNRKVDIPGGCMKNTTSDTGKLIPCPGELFGIIRPGDSLLPSTIMCSDDPEHQVPVGEWIPLGRRLHKERKVAS